jgi:Mrp family chromosome partitioning ATPase
MAITSMRREDEAVEPNGVDAAWERLRTVTLDRRHLARQRVIAADRVDPAHVAFDVLRTRLLQTLRARGWRRVAITSPTQGCGKTFVAANLALSLSRRASCRTVLIDLDLRIPSLAAVLGVGDVDYLHPFLAGKQPAEAHLVRARPNLALGLNAGPVFDAAELLQEPATAQALMEMQAALEPDVVLYERLFADQAPLIGVILNMAEDPPLDPYYAMT